MIGSAPEMLISSLFFGAIAALNRIIPKTQILLLSGFPDIEDQGVAVMRYALPNLSCNWRIVLLVRGDIGSVRSLLARLVGAGHERVEIYAKTSLRGMWCYLRSRVVMFTHGLYGFHQPPRSQVVVNLWHGMPIKAIWKATPNSPVPGCTWLLATSEKFKQVLCSVSGLAIDQILPTGLPRNDLLRIQSKATDQFFDDARRDVDRLVLFLPTFRKTNLAGKGTDGIEAAGALPMLPKDVSQLKVLLRSHQARMLVKPHPLSVHSGEDSEVDENIWIISDRWLNAHGVTLYEVLGRIDLLITDISSVYVDFLATGKPALCYFPDLAEYRSTRRFLLEPVEDWLPSPVFKEFAELHAAMELCFQGHDVYAQQRIRLAAELNPHRKETATKSLFEALGGVWR